MKLTNKVESLLYDLCVNWGFCLPSEDVRRISELPYLDAKDFACQVLVAEGMNPDCEKQWKRKISKKFIEKNW